MSRETVIRPALAADLPDILSVESSCRSVTWSPRGFAQELSDENSLSLVALAAGLMAGREAGHEAGGDVCGYVLSRCAADECTVHTLGVLPSWRRRGIGTALMQALMAHAARRGIATVFLEVRSKNGGAQAFYSALGFTPCGTRKAYYADDHDDAITMTRVLARPLHLSA